MAINKEELALELILTSIQTGKPLVVIERAIEELAKVNKNKIAEKLDEVQKYVKNGYNIVDSFYYADFLKDETYGYLILVNKKGGISESFIKSFLSEYREKRNLLKKTFSSFLAPASYILLSALMGVFIIKQFMILINSSTKNADYPFWMSFHVFIASHPIMGFFILLLTSILILGGIVLFIFRKIGYKEMKIYFLASLLHILRSQGVTYSEIFDAMTRIEKDKKFKSIFEQIAIESRTLKAFDALRPLYEMLPLNVSLLIQSFLERSEDAEGWRMVRNEMKAIADAKLQAFAEVAPLVGYIFVAFVIIFSMLPLKVAITSLIANISSGF